MKNSTNLQRGFFLDKRGAVQIGRYLIYITIFLASIPLNYIIVSKINVAGRPIYFQTVFGFFVVSISLFIVVSILFFQNKIEVPRYFLYFVLYILILPFITGINKYTFNFLFRIIYILAFSTLFLNCFKFESFYKLTKLIIISGIIVALIGIYFDFDVFVKAVAGSIRFYGLGSGFKHAFGMGFYFIVVYFLWRCAKLPSIISFPLLILFGLEMLLTLSRGAIFSSFLVIALTELFLLKKKSPIIFLLITFMIFTASYQLKLFSRITPYIERKDVFGLTGGRLSTWFYMLPFLKDHPDRIIFGFGPGYAEKILREKNMVLPHNIYLTLLFDTGIIGLFLFVYFICYLYKKTKYFFKYPPYSNEYICASLSLISLFMFAIRGVLDECFSAYIQMGLYFVYPLLCLLVKQKFKNSYNYTQQNFANNNKFRSKSV